MPRHHHDADHLRASIFLAIVAITTDLAVKLGINNQFALFYGGTRC